MMMRKWLLRLAVRALLFLNIVAFVLDLLSHQVSLAIASFVMATILALWLWLLQPDRER